jgi:hypothetical protein
VSVAQVGDLNAWSILRPRALLMTTAAIDAFRASVKESAAVRKPAASKKKPAREKPAAKATARKTARQPAKREK